MQTALVGRGRVLRSVAAVLALWALASVPASASVPQDPLAAEQVAQLHAFSRWLKAAGVGGYIGEVGWPHGPDAQAWNGVADAWYHEADRDRLWVTAWATGEWWGTSYPLSVYIASGGGAVDATEPQADVVADHPGTQAYRRGVNVAGGEFGAPSVAPTSSFSNHDPGRYGIAYHYDSRATFDYLAAHGIELVRLPFRWERLQPRLGGPLDRAELRRLKAAVARAGAAGLKVILDLHNYGGYYLYDGTQGVRRTIGSPQLPIRRFADLWRRISRNFGHNPTVIGYDLMNEPVGLAASGGRSPAQVWYAASQAAVDRIRAHGDSTLILVEGYGWSGVWNWTTTNPRPWIHDPAHHFRYEAHQYFDHDHSGTYTWSFDAEEAQAQAEGY